MSRLLRSGMISGEVARRGGWLIGMRNAGGA
jgi:hypothetical protein